MTTYTVKSGDSLSRIAANVLGNMAQWPQIASLNSISAPYVIYPGQVLQLPGAGPAAGPTESIMPISIMPVAVAPGVRKFPAPGAPASSGIVDWIMANKMLVGGGIALVGVSMLAMNAQKKKAGRKARTK